MVTKKRLILVFIILLIIILIVSLFFNLDKKLLNPPSFEGFSLDKTFEEGKIAQIFLYKGGENIIRLQIISNIDKESALNLIKGNVLNLEALYGNAISPYPGIISDEIVYGEKFIPEKKSEIYNGREITYFNVYLSERLGYGINSDDVAFYRGINSWTYCSKKEEYRQFEFISPKESFDENAIEFVKENICN